MAKEYNKSNFHKHTFCVFTEVELKTISSVKPNYKSKSGSSYYFTETGVFRLSNHWGRAANCTWRLQNINNSKNQDYRLGFALWTEFHTDNDTEKLYYIEVDFDTNTVNYQHKANLYTAVEPTMRTATETEKRIKQIRNLLTTDSWAAYYSMEINALREAVILELVHTQKTLQQIKSALINE